MIRQRVAERDAEPEPDDPGPGECAAVPFPDAQLPDDQLAVDEPQVDQLLRRYRQEPAVDVRDQLLARYHGLVEGIARGLAARLPRSVDVQDLVHAGVWGLIQAIDHFEPERGTSFVSFMRLRVRGAMVDELRHLDYLPRLMRIRLREREDARVRLRSGLQREPSDAELATELGVSETVLRSRYAAVEPIRRCIPQNQAADGEETQETDLLEKLADEACEAPIEAIYRRELLDLIAQSLEPLEWEVLRMHYLEGMTGRDVAKKLRLSASRICQIHGRVLSRLKAKLSAQN